MQKNSKMVTLMNHMSLNEESDANISLDQLLKLLQPIIKNVHGCLVIDNTNEIKCENINLDRILKIHGDKTGYEASNNEMRINDFVDGNSIDFKDVLALGFNILDFWSNRLKKEYPDNRFCFIISCESEFVTLRFHQIRENESRWISDDLERYEDAIAFKTI